MDFHCSTVDFVFSPYVCAGIVGLQGFTALKPQKVFFHFARDSGSQWCQYSCRPKSVTTCVSFSCGFVEKVYKVTGCSVAFFWRKGSATPSQLTLAKCQHPTEPRPTGLEIFFITLKEKRTRLRGCTNHMQTYSATGREKHLEMFFCNITLNIVSFMLLPDKEDRHKRVAQRRTAERKFWWKCPRKFSNRKGQNSRRKSATFITGGSPLQHHFRKGTMQNGWTVSLGSPNRFSSFFLSKPADHCRMPS